MSLRELEAESIRDFVLLAAQMGYLSGRVLDYGCGKQPYRDIVEATGGEYLPFDRNDYPANTSGADWGDLESESPEEGSGFDAILCTQVVQYVPLLNEESEFFDSLRWLIRDHGHLVLTYPTNWPEVEPEDLHRFTKAGMERLLIEAGFEIVVHERRAEVYCVIGDQSFHNEPFALGYGVIARA